MAHPIYEPVTFETAGVEGEATTGGAYRGAGWNLWSNGVWTMRAELPESGRYRFTVRAFGTQAGDEPVRAQLSVNETVVHSFEVPNTADFPEDFAHELVIEEGAHTFGVAFTNDYYNPDAGEDRNLIIIEARVEGPLELRLEGEAPRDRLISCDPDEVGARACAGETLGRFLPRAWRRPVADAERDRIMAIYDLITDEGGDFDEGLHWAFVAALISPHFVFRVEPDPTLGEVRPLDHFEIASRLSYFFLSVIFVR